MYFILFVMEQLTNEDSNYIIEALLFALCLEITDRWTVEDRAKMLNIAKNLKNENTVLKNLDLHVFNEDQDLASNEVFQSFSNINLIKMDAENINDI